MIDNQYEIMSRRPQQLIRTVNRMLCSFPVIRKVCCEMLAFRGVRREHHKRHSSAHARNGISDVIGADRVFTSIQREYRRTKRPAPRVQTAFAATVINPSRQTERRLRADTIKVVIDRVGSTPPSENGSSRKP